jgi:hypothetical protein
MLRNEQLSFSRPIHIICEVKKIILYNVNIHVLLQLKIGKVHPGFTLDYIIYFLGRQICRTEINNVKFTLDSRTYIVQGVNLV